MTAAATRKQHKLTKAMETALLADPTGDDAIGSERTVIALIDRGLAYPRWNCLAPSRLTPAGKEARTALRAA
ncbi:hypothetical protein ACTWJ9_33355 (plasmid) [Streptomyces sp. GDS52]|uniref:hypothetical protein n=1 Tax=Streptomyces sp. GDS52 TaxID=3406419 RepID=UPI003FD51F27